MLTRDQILARSDEIPTEDVDVPEWGGTVKIRCLTTRERMQWARALSDAQAGKPAPDPTALVVALGAVDDAGAKLFSVQDTDVLAEMRGDIIERVSDAVMELSGMGPDDKGDKAAADAEGNSVTSPSSDSSTDSPAISDAPSPN